MPRKEVANAEARTQARLARWRRVARPIGRIAGYVRRVHDEVAFRPGGTGAKRAREEFEEAAGKLQGT